MPKYRKVSDHLGFGEASPSGPAFYPLRIIENTGLGIRPPDGSGAPNTPQTLNTGFTLAHPLDFRPESGRVIWPRLSAKALSLPEHPLLPPHWRSIHRQSSHRAARFHGNQPNRLRSTPNYLRSGTKSKEISAKATTFALQRCLN